jgi:hypothetical protein
MRARVHRWLLGSMLLAFGCAHAPAPHAEAPPPKLRIKLAVLPVDGDQFPHIAASLNNALHDVKLDGVDDYFLSKVTLEVVQLSIECVQPSSECLSAVGKSLSANKFLMGRVVGVGKRKRDRSVRVTITLFDVDAGAASNVVDRVYRTQELASEGAHDLVAEAATIPPKAAGPEAAPKGGAAKQGPVARGGRR